MEKIMDGFLFTLGSSFIIIPFFYVCSVQLLKVKKQIVTTSLDHFSDSLFGNIFKPSTTQVINTKPSNERHSPLSKNSELTSFFVKKRGIQ